MYYLDTSILVSGLTRETATERVILWLENYQSQGLWISRWTITEFASALSLKIRTAQISPSTGEDVESTFATMLDDGISVLQIAAEDFLKAARYARHHALGLRAGDALHLAVASRHDLVMCTLDRRMAAAGRALGMAVISP
ncbi:type II toxin-antitoxin system VapC family toxin [Tistrella mobilis]|uniref:type II toxin-antitoxin system VapC family toxin n=1 Tax=Tistrella mobilis TaxID=171437 RepID=UPI0005A1FCD0|nr:type II toxin-antitoxin system VapC family toxin [Tistrella mobilis]